MAYRSTRPRAKFFNMGHHALVGRDAPQGVIQGFFLFDRRRIAFDRSRAASISFCW